MAELKGKTIRGFEFLELIGKGGFGEVYRAFQSSVDREVAIKVIRPEKASSRKFKKRFKMEAKLVAKLEHPHIVPLYDYWQDGQGAFLVMRWLSGGTVRDLLKSGPLKSLQIIELIEQIGSALMIAHKNKVIHRDIKPENILFDGGDNYYLSDFGIAKDLKREIDKDSTTGILGTPAYLSPEQALEKKVTSKSDIYSLGVILYELITGAHPFPNSDPISQIIHHARDPLPSLELEKTEISTRLNEIIQTATSKDPANRFSNVEDFSTSLVTALNNTRIKYINVKRAQNIKKQYTVPKSYVPDFMLDKAQLKIDNKNFVGRKREIRLLTNFLQKSRAGKGQIALIMGEVGSGKTTLLDMFARESLERFDDVVFASSAFTFQGRISEPFLPFKDVLNQLTGNVDLAWKAGEMSQEGAKRLWNLLPHSIAGLLSISPDLIDTFLSGNALAARASLFQSGDNSWKSDLSDLINQKTFYDNSGEESQNRLLHQFSNLLGHLAQNSTIIIMLDDLQWIDGASAELLAQISKTIRKHKLFIIGAYRPENIDLGYEIKTPSIKKILPELKMRFGKIEIEIEPSQQEQYQGFVDEYLDTKYENLEAEFRNKLATRTKGNPLFVKELVRDLESQGKLYRNPKGDWKTKKDIDWNRIPTRIEGVIESRLNEVNEKLRNILEVASVEGMEFTPEIIAEVLGIDELSLVNSLSHKIMTKHRLVRETKGRLVGSRLVSQYQFEHFLHRQFVYKNLGLGKKHLLHGKIARELEKLYFPEYENIAASLAYHFCEINDVSKCIKYLVIAGEASLKLFAYREAINHLLKAKSLLENVEENESQLDSKLVDFKLKIFELLGSAYLGIGILKKAEESLLQAVNIIDRRLIKPNSEIYFSIASQILFQLFIRFTSKYHLFQRIGEGQIDVNIQMARLYSQLGTIYYLRNDTLKTVYILIRTLNIAEHTKNSYERADAYATAIVAAGLIPIHVIAEHYSILAENVATLANSPRASARVSMLKGIYLIGTGQLEKASNGIIGGLETSNKIGDTKLWGECLVNLANISMLEGDYSLGRERFKLLERKSSNWGNHLHQVWALEGLANLSLRQGDPKIAEKLILQALNLLSDNPDLISEIELYGLLGLACLRQGNNKAAYLNAGESAQRIAHLSPTAYSLFQGYSGVCEVFLSQMKTSQDQQASEDKLKESTSLAQKACLNFIKYSKIFSLGKPIAHYYLAIYYLNLGNEKKAFTLLRRGLGQSIKIKLPYEQALIDFEIGRNITNDDKLRIFHLERAKKIFSELHAVDFLEQTMAIINT